MKRLMLILCVILVLVAAISAEPKIKKEKIESQGKKKDTTTGITIWRQRLMPTPGAF
jgi:hypothetical protein